MERVGNVTRIYLRLPMVSGTSWRPAISADHPLLCFRRLGAVSRRPYRDGVSGRIPQPNRGHVHRTGAPSKGASMTGLSRRKLIKSGLLLTAGAAGLGAATKLAAKYGLVPPDHGGLFGPGETLTYATQRLLTKHSMAREFSRDKLSPRPFPNELAPLTDEFKRHQANGFADWKLKVDGLVQEPASFSIADL